MNNKKVEFDKDFGSFSITNFLKKSQYNFSFDEQKDTKLELMAEIFNETYKGLLASNELTCKLKQDDLKKIIYGVVSYINKHKDQFSDIYSVLFNNYSPGEIIRIIVNAYNEKLRTFTSKERSTYVNKFDDHQFYSRKVVEYVRLKSDTRDFQFVKLHRNSRFKAYSHEFTTLNKVATYIQRFIWSINVQDTNLRFYSIMAQHIKYTFFSDIAEQFVNLTDTLNNYSPKIAFTNLRTLLEYYSITKVLHENSTDVAEAFIEFGMLSEYIHLDLIYQNANVEQLKQYERLAVKLKETIKKYNLILDEVNRTNFVQYGWTLEVKGN